MNVFRRGYKYGFSAGVIIDSLSHYERYGRIARTALALLCTMRRVDSQTHSRNVSRQTASRYGRAISSSCGISPPAFNLASLISVRSFCCTFGFSANRCRVCAKAIVVVLVAAKTMILFYVSPFGSTFTGSKQIGFWTHDI